MQVMIGLCAFFGGELMMLEERCNHRTSWVLKKKQYQEDEEDGYGIILNVEEES